MLIIPFPAIVVDILIGVNILQVTLIFIFVLSKIKATDLLLLPKIVLLSMVFGLLVNISAVRLILAKRGDFNGWAIRTVSSLFTSSDEIAGLVAGFIGFIAIISFLLLVIIKVSTRISEVAARFTLDSLPCKQMAIDTEYSCGKISEEEYKTRKENLQ